METMKLFKTMICLLLKPFIFVIQIGLTAIAIVFSTIAGIGEVIGGILGIIFITTSLLGLLMGVVEGNVFWEMLLGGIAFKVIPTVIRVLCEEGIFAIKGALYDLIQEV